MAKSFSVKNYFKKIHAHELIADLYEKHSIVAILGITENTPRKNAVDIMMDFYKSIEPEQKIDIEKELALISTLSTKHAVPLFISLLKKNNLPFEETLVECKTDEDRVLYYYLNHKDIFDEVMFYHDFYVSRGYMLYEAKKVDMTAAELAITELTKEFKRIANKDDNATECSVTAKSLDNILYIHATFEGTREIKPKFDKETGEIDRTRTVRRQEEVKIAYLPNDEEVLISYTGGKYEKLIFLDTFLRVVCNSGYQDKVEMFDLSFFKKEDFDFSRSGSQTPLLTWKIKGVTLSFGQNEKAKKKMRLSLPSSNQEHMLSPLFASLDELDLKDKYQMCGVENIVLNFIFQDTRKPEKSVKVACSLSSIKSSLCPLFPYDRYARTLLKNSGIDRGFIESVKKDAEKVNKKWEA